MKHRRILSVAICVLLIASFTIISFAASATFFTQTVYGYRCTGRGSISLSTATSTLNAETIPNQQHIPSNDCSASAWVTAYGSNGQYLGSEHVTGKTFAKATIEGGSPIKYIKCGFDFTGTHFDIFTLYNS